MMQAHERSARYNHTDINFKNNQPKMSKFGIPPPNSNTGMTRVECFYNYSNSVNPSITNGETIKPDSSKLDGRDKDKKLS